MNTIENKLPPESKYCQLEIYLKSGHTIEVTCEDYKFNRNAVGNYTGYELGGIIKPKSLSFDFNEMVGFIVK